MATKPKLSFWQIWNMSFGFLGIQFGFALQNANVSRIFETLGADVEDIPILWIAAPVTGLIVQPIIGYFSDRTWGRLGRRRPYFLFGAIFASAALFFMPNSPSLWIAAGMLWIMDASINVSMEPFRAFVGDNLPSEQRTIGFAMQSFFIGIGAVIASMLPYVFTNWFGISNEAPKGIIPPSVKWSFYVGGIVFFLAVLWTVIRSKEYPPEELEAFEEEEKKDEYEKEALTEEVAKKKGKRQVTVGGVILLLGIALTIALTQMNVDKQIFIFGGGLIFVGLLFLLSGLIQSNGNYENGFVTIMNDLQDMPLTMKQLAWVQFFSWFALFCMWLYTTAGVTSDKYDMQVNAEEVQYLQGVVDDLEGEEAEKVKNNLAEIKDKFVAGREEVVIPVNLANYFLEGKLVEEEELVDKALASLDQVSTKDKAFEAAKKELEDLQSRYNDDLKGNEKIITYNTFDFLQKNSTTLFKQDVATVGEPLKMAHRLKYVQKEYNDGADWVGVCFAVYNGLASLFAFVLMWLAKVTNRKMTHAISLIVGAISFVSIFFISDPWYLLISFIGIGMAWASILAMPYAILTGSIPSNKMGYYMGVFNFFIVIPQILAATILGFMVAKVFEGEAIYISLVAAGAFALAALLTMRVYDKDDVVG